MLVMTIFILTIIGFKEFLPLLKKKYLKEAIVFLMFTSLNLVIAILIFFNIHIPTPEQLIFMIGDWLFPNIQ